MDSVTATTTDTESMPVAKSAASKRQASATSDRTDEREQARLREFQFQFGQKLREARNAKGWSMEELSEKSGLHRQTLYRYEGGTMHPSLYFVVRIAKALGVDVGELMPEVK